MLRCVNTLQFTFQTSINSHLMIFLYVIKRSLSCYSAIKRMYGDILTGLHLDSMLEVLGLTSTPQYECRPSLSQSYPLDGHTCGTGYDQTTNRWLRIRPCCLQLNNNKNNWLHIFALRNACKKNCPFTVFRLDVSSPICPLYIP